MKQYSKKYVTQLRTKIKKLETRNTTLEANLETKTGHYDITTTWLAEIAEAAKTDHNLSSNDQANLVRSIKGIGEALQSIRNLFPTNGSLTTFQHVEQHINMVEAADAILIKIKEDLAGQCNIYDYTLGRKKADVLNAAGYVQQIVDRLKGDIERLEAKNDVFEDGLWGASEFVTALNKASEDA